jgi:hypothetical protein
MHLLAACKAFGLGALCAWVLASTVGCSEDADEGDTSGTGTVRWCQVSAVLAAKCQRCHVGAGLHDAPFPLVSYEDTQVLHASIDKRRWQLMQTMVEQGFMPPDDPQLQPPVEKLTSDEKAVLTTWFNEGAEPVGGTNCP